jgi:hypothetical protein
MISWLRHRLASGWVEIEAHPGQPITAMHGPTVRLQAAADVPQARAFVGLVEVAELLVRGVIDGTIPAPAWLDERHRTRTSARRAA